MKVLIRSKRPLSKAELRAIAKKLEHPGAAEAARGYKRFHWGNNPEKIARASIPDPRRGLYELGKLRAVEYETDKGGEKAVWVHRFTRPYPSLTAVGKRLGPIVGGAAIVTERGIEK